MSEVYCIKCKWFHGNIHYPNPSCDYCSAPEFGVIKDYIYGDKQKVAYVGDPFYPNKRGTNGCSFFVEKPVDKPKPWWKKVF